MRVQLLNLKCRANYLLYEPRVLSPLEHWAAWTKRFTRTIAGDGLCGKIVAQ